VSFKGNIGCYQLTNSEYDVVDSVDDVPQEPVGIHARKLAKGYSCIMLSVCASAQYTTKFSVFGAMSGT